VLHTCLHRGFSFPEALGSLGSGVGFLPTLCGSLSVFPTWDSLPAPFLNPTPPLPGPSPPGTCEGLGCPAPLGWQRSPHHPLTSCSPNDSESWKLIFVLCTVRGCQPHKGAKTHRHHLETPRQQWEVWMGGEEVKLSQLRGCMEPAADLLRSLGTEKFTVTNWNDTEIRTLFTLQPHVLSPAAKQEQGWLSGAPRAQVARGREHHHGGMRLAEPGMTQPARSPQSQCHFGVQVHPRTSPEAHRYQQLSLSGSEQLSRP
jgi:hypothetical protein